MFLRRPESKRDYVITGIGMVAAAVIGFPIGGLIGGKGADFFLSVWPVSVLSTGLGVAFFLTTIYRYEASQRRNNR